MFNGEFRNRIRFLYNSILPRLSLSILFVKSYFVYFSFLKNGILERTEQCSMYLKSFSKRLRLYILKVIIILFFFFLFWGFLIWWEGG